MTKKTRRLPTELLSLPSSKKRILDKGSKRTSSTSKTRRKKTKQIT